MKCLDKLIKQGNKNYQLKNRISLHQSEQKDIIRSTIFAFQVSRFWCNPNKYQNLQPFIQNLCLKFNYL